MQILQVVQKNFDSLGFSRKLVQFNRRIVSINIMAISGLILLWIFLLHEANNSQEYMESIHFILGGGGIFACNINTTFIREKMFSFINDVDEKFIESKF